MLYRLSELNGYAIDATDGAVGEVKDFYFDDKAWVVRYLIVDTGGWLSSRKVLISPIAVGRPNRAQKQLPASITRDEVKNSPDIDTEKPVSRQHEIEYSQHFGYPFYWGGAGLWGGGLYPNAMLPGQGGFGSPQAERQEREAAYAEADAQRDDADPHLRSGKVVTGYHIQATDGEIGHVEDMLADEETWAIRYLVVDTSNWWFGHKVLVAPQWISGVNWHDETVPVDLTRQAVKDAPAYDPATELDREHEIDIHSHYGRAGYWVDSPRRDTDISRD
jgi:sporulation protein YlmC with PRC-barrel domain